MPQTDDFCLVCVDTCTCQTKRKRRRPKATQPVKKQPLDKPQPSSAEHQPERRSARRVAGRSATEGIQVDEEDEETAMITAIRALAHLVNHDDLEPFREHLMPSDYLPPDQRAASWRKRTNE